MGSLAVLPRLPPTFGVPGLLTIGFLVVYLPMLVIDGFLAFFWGRSYEDNIRFSLMYKHELTDAVSENGDAHSPDGSSFAKLWSDAPGPQRSSFNIDASNSRPGPPDV